MAYKNILVHLDQTPRSDLRFELALDLAKRQQARLSVFYATSMPYMFQGEEKSRRAQIEDEKKSLTHQAGVDFAWVPEIEDTTIYLPLATRLNYQAYFADVTIVGQPGADAGPPPAPPRNLPERLILTTGRPIITIPFAGHFQQIGTRIMVAWRSGRASARAVMDALPLMIKADFVHLISFATTIAERTQAEATLDKLFEHLTQHGANVVIEARLISNISFSDALLNRVAEEGTDLLVVGGALPSAPAPMATQLLKQMTVPVLMSS